MTRRSPSFRGLLIATSGILPVLLLTTVQPAAAGTTTPSSSTAASAASQLPVVSARRLSLERVQTASKTGRYIVGYASRGAGGAVLRDTVSARTVATFPRTAASFSISDDGRFVAYTLPGTRRVPEGRLQRDVRVFDRTTGRTRSAVTTSSGKALRPSWRTSCTEESCDENLHLADAPQLAGGQISGNGRYIVYCANYAKPGRVDLYIKDWRTKKLTTVKGACSFDDDSDVGEELVRAPSVSEDGNTILLPGWRSYGEVGNGFWEPSRALLKRKTLINVGGIAPTMTDDGKLISTRGAFRNRSHGYGSEEELPVTWLRLPNRTKTPANPSGLQLTMDNASRHGRFVVTTSDREGQGSTLDVWDRTTNRRYDLGAAVTATRAQASQGWSRDPVITGDGTTVIAEREDGTWWAIRWTA